ncbi:MFS transporter [Rickettsia peacockii]|uniref:MFS transporter n=1 Tax=Rickettsia peacockii TaxID=47589 RepID=UPI0002E2BB55|nr:MFS transporter [Rickettsia peacockii]
MTSVFANLGGMIALAVASLVTSFGFNWRIAFLLGTIIAIVGAVARTALRETPEFADAKRRVKKNITLIQKTTDNPLKDNLIYNERVNLKTVFFLLLISCGWPICFYFTYIYCGEILKNSFNFTAEAVIHHNFIVAIVNFCAYLILNYLSYIIYPLKILKIKLVIFFIFALICPYLLNNITTSVHYQWTTPERIVSPQYFRDHHIPLKQDNGVISCGNPVITFLNNQLLIFSKIGPYPRTWSGILSRAYDQGLTWQKPELLHGILGPARNKPLIYENNILSPCSRESCIDDFSYIEYSSDLHTWNLSNPILPSNPQIFQKGYRGFIQPTLVSSNLPNKIIMLVRPRKTDSLMSTYIHRSISINNGIYWSNLEPVNLLNPDSAIDAINLGDDTLLLTYNRVINNHKSRNILSVATSYDEGLGTLSLLEILSILKGI